MTDQGQCIVLLAMQQALPGEVSERLRAVEVSWTETRIHFNGYSTAGTSQALRCGRLRSAAVLAVPECIVAAGAAIEGRPSPRLRNKLLIA